MLAEPGSPNPSNLVTKPKKFIANKVILPASSNIYPPIKYIYFPTSFVHI